MEATNNLTRATETPRISTEAAETVTGLVEGEKEAEVAENNESAELLAVIKRHEWGATPILFAYDPDKHIASATFKSSSGGISVVNAKCENGCYCHVYDSCMTIEELAWKNIHTHNVMKPQQSPDTPQTAECAGESPEARETAEIKITSITQLNVLKYKLQHPRLKEWAVKFGLLDLVRNMYCAPELSLGGLWIDNKFHQSLCENDKMIINAVRKLIADAEKAA